MYLHELYGAAERVLDEDGPAGRLDLLVRASPTNKRRGYVTHPHVWYIFEEGPDPKTVWVREYVGNVLAYCERPEGGVPFHNDKPIMIDVDRVRRAPPWTRHEVQIIDP